MDYFLQIQSSIDRNNLWGISYDALLTGLVPILLFIVAYIFKRLNEGNKEKKRLKEVEEYFKQSIELLKVPILRQIESINEFSSSLNEKREMPLYLNHIAGFHIHQIKEINSKDLFTIFILNKKGGIVDKTELFAKLRASIDFIDTVKKSISDDFLTFCEKVDRNQEEYRSNVEITDEAFYKMLSASKNGSINQDSFLTHMQEIRFNWQSFKKDGVNYTDRYITKEKYLEPMRELCAHNINDHRAAFILKHILRCIYAFNDIEELKRFFGKEFLLTARQLEQSWLTIDSVLEKFELMEV